MDETGTTNGKKIRRLEFLFVLTTERKTKIEIRLNIRIRASHRNQRSRRNLSGTRLYVHGALSQLHRRVPRSDQAPTVSTLRIHCQGNARRQFIRSPPSLFFLSIFFCSFFFSTPSGPVPRLQTSLYNIINRIQSPADQLRMFSFCLLPGRGLFFFGRSLGYFTVGIGGVSSSFLPF